LALGVTIPILWIGATRGASMAFFGHYLRNVDRKGRTQLPAPLRAEIERRSDRPHPGVYAVLGDRKNTLKLVTEPEYDLVAAHFESQDLSTPEGLDASQRFFATVSYLDIDAQGRIVLPDYLTGMAKLEGEVILAGRNTCIDVWRKSDFEAFIRMGEANGWPDLSRYVRPPRPQAPPPSVPDAGQG